MGWIQPDGRLSAESEQACRFNRATRVKSLGRRDAVGHCQPDAAGYAGEVVHAERDTSTQDDSQRHTDHGGITGGRPECPDMQRNRDHDARNDVTVRVTRDTDVWKVAGTINATSLATMPMSTAIARLRGP